MLAVAIKSNVITEFFFTFIFFLKKNYINLSLDYNASIPILSQDGVL